MDLRILASSCICFTRFLGARACRLQAKQKAPGGRQKAYGHSGILSAAEAVLADLKANGILQTLLEPEGVRSRSLEIQRARAGQEAQEQKSGKRGRSQSSARREGLDEAFQQAGVKSSPHEKDLSDAENGKAGSTDQEQVHKPTETPVPAYRDSGLQV